MTIKTETPYEYWYFLEKSSYHKKGTTMAGVEKYEQSTKWYSILFSLHFNLLSDEALFDY